MEARITSAEQNSSVTEANRAGWNLIADRRPGVPVERFRRGEVCLEDFERRLAGDLVEIDLIYLSWGALCWAPDLGVLAGIIAGRLRPGGAVLICEHHPAWEVLAVRDEGVLTVAGDYFGRGRPNPEQDDAKRPAGARGEAGAPPFAAFVWPVSDVVKATKHVQP